MADFVFNIAKGKVAEYAERVLANDPTDSALIVVVLALSGLESDAVLKDKDTLAAVLSGATNEVTNTGYARKTVTNPTVTVDDTNDRTNVDMGDQTWAAVDEGDVWAKALICYDGDTAGGTDANIIPLVALDFAVTPDGSEVKLQFNSNGFFRAS